MAVKYSVTTLMYYNLFTNIYSNKLEMLILLVIKILGSCFFIKALLTIIVNFLTIIVIFLKRTQKIYLWNDKNGSKLCKFLHKKVKEKLFNKIQLL
jgi:hypothetical protein